jgi:arylformamidase
LSKVFRDYDQAELDAQYEQRVWAPRMDHVIQRYADASDAARARIGEPVTYAYGPSAAETMDVYGANGKKAFVFVHGGSWRRQSKRESAFAAEAVVQAGATYVALGFAPLPAVTLPQMVSQVCCGIEWVKQRLDTPIVLCGHSSGGHLAACALSRIDCVEQALVISGIYDLLPVRLSSRNAFVRLDPALERELSPIRHFESIRCPMTVAWAEKESAEFARQSREFAAVLRSPTIIGEGLDHFGFAETLADPGSPLGAAALAMLE